MGPILSLLGMLVAVAAILFAAYFVTKWIAAWSAPGFTAARGDERLSVLGRISLGRDGQAVVLQIGERCLLLGVTPANISLIRELDEDEAAQWISGEAQEKIAPPSFLEALQRNWPKKK